MKAIPLQEAQQRLGELIAEACRGELIVLTDGEKQVALEPNFSVELEADSPEMEAELLKAIEGPFKPYSAEEMRLIGERIIRERQRE